MRGAMRKQEPGDLSPVTLGPAEAGGPRPAGLPAGRPLVGLIGGPWTKEKTNWLRMNISLAISIMSGKEQLVQIEHQRLGWKLT